MFGPSFNDYTRTALEKIKNDVLHESDTQILGSEVDALAEYYFNKYALNPIDFDQESLSCEIKKEIRRVPAQRREYGYRDEGDLDYEYETAVISVEIQPNKDLDTIKKLHGNTIVLDGFEQHVNYGHTTISYSFDIKGYGIQYDEERTANKINEASNTLIGKLIAKNGNINTENISFLISIKTIVGQRKEKLTADMAKLNSLTQKIKIPIKEKFSEPYKRIAVDTKKFVQKVKPTPKLPEEYVLEESILAGILKYVDNQCQSFERTPHPYKALGEEDLRDLILAALNGIFEGNATGETFVKNGKTDIHLKIEKGEILIFECKIWGGEKLYLETIDQLIGYLTWRQNYGVVVMFCRNKDFSKILAQIPDIIQKHQGYFRGYSNLGNSHFVSEHNFPEDAGKTIKVHHLIYNLYAD